MSTWVTKEFNSLVKGDIALPVCAMKVLGEVIQRSSAQTWMQLEQELSSAIKELKLFDTSLLGTLSDSPPYLSPYYFSL